METRYRIWGLDASGSLQGACSAGSGQAGGVGGLLATTTVDESTEQQTSVAHYFCYDGNGNGNVTQLLNSEATLAAHYEYGPFGELLVAEDTFALENTYRFSTKPNDKVTGLYYYGYRYYTPHHRPLAMMPRPAGLAIKLCLIYGTRIYLQ